MTPRTLISAGLLWATAFSPLTADQAASLTLAKELADDQDHAGAALEYRRLAMDATDGSAKGSLFWMSAYEYIAAGRYPQAERMLGQVETVAPDLETEVYLLHGDHNRARHRLREAAFYLESLTDSARPEPVRTAAAKRLAAVRVQMRDFDGARDALRETATHDLDAGLDAVTVYEAGEDKSHVVGGLLGLIPGLGYAYSGEYANAARSLILNGLCIWGLAEFIEEEQWGGVALVGFAEVTFYSGSIYGGADAAVRHNRRRLRECTEAIEGDVDIQPDRAALPVLTLKYKF